MPAAMQLNGEGTLCNVMLTAPRLMAAPVFLYYELDNFYQNHRRWSQRLLMCMISTSSSHA